jgi:hypothetical protein
MNGTRNDCMIDQDCDLYFTFLKNGLPYTVYNFQKVELFSTREDAIAGTNIIHTITSGDITEVTTGKYRYTAPITQTGLFEIGTFFDRVYIYPESNSPLWNDPVYKNINTFNIRATDLITPPANHEKTNVYLNMFDVIDLPQKGDVITVRMNVPYAWYGNDLIQQEEETFRIDSSGTVTMPLIETETLTEDTFGTETGETRQVYYEIKISGKLFAKVSVPKGVGSINFKDLPQIVTSESTPNDIDVGLK